MMKVFFTGVGNIAEKGEHAGYETNGQTNRLTNKRTDRQCKNYIPSPATKSFKGSMATKIYKQTIRGVCFFVYFCLFIVATGCPSERRPQKTVSCYGG